MNDQESIILEAEVSDEEIKKALQGIGNDKAPGLDGFNALFFKSDWDLINPDLRNAVKKSFHSGTILNNLILLFYA